MEKLGGVETQNMPGKVEVAGMTGTKGLCWRKVQNVVYIFA